MAERALPSGWRSDEDGNVYRLLTPSEQAQIERTRGERPGAEDVGAVPHEAGGSAAAELAPAS